MTQAETTGTRPVRRLEPLDVEECMRLLEDIEVGRLAFLRDGRPDVLPMNCRYWQGAVVFRTSWGDLVDRVHNQHVAVEVDGLDEATRTGWSVVVHGVGEEIWRPDELEQARDNLDLQPWAGGEREHWMRVLPRSITGRRIVTG